MDRKPTQIEMATERRPGTNAADSSRPDTFREEVSAGYLSSWNSWGERNPLTLGSYGRW